MTGRRQRGSLDADDPSTWRSSSSACRAVLPIVRTARRASPGSELEDGVGGGGLHDDHAQVVGDDVVHLARDPRLLLGRGAARVRLLLALELGRPLLDGPQVRAAVAEVVAEDPGRRERRHLPGEQRERAPAERLQSISVAAASVRTTMETAPAMKAGRRGLCAATL